jgi:thymidine kinase
VRHNYLENGGHVLLFTSGIDDRAGVGRVSSRLGHAADAVAVSSADDLFDMVRTENDWRPVTVLLIDEVQFLTGEQIRQAARVADVLDIPVMCYGLKVNAFGELFGEAVHVLLALADQVQELKQLCHCRRKANMILRYGPDGAPVRSGNVVEIGGEDRYVSVCRRHWMDGDIGPARRAALGINKHPD